MFGLPDAESWFARRGWRPFDFQRTVWAAMADGRSGLLHATSGAGKTCAVALGALLRAAALGLPVFGPSPGKTARRRWVCCGSPRCARWPLTATAR